MDNTLHQKPLNKTDSLNPTTILDDEVAYRFLLEHMSEVIWQASSDLRFTYASPVIERLTGYSVPEVIGRSIFDFLTPASAEYIHETVTERQRLAQRGEHLEKYTYEIEYVCKDGKLLWGEVISYAMQDSEGRLMSFSGIMRDITDRRQAEERLWLQGLVLDQIKEAVTVTDLNGFITYVNEAQINAVGYRRNELIGRHTTIFGEGSQTGSTQREIIEQTLDNGAWEGQVLNYTADGRAILLDCRTNLVRDKQGKPIAMAGAATDITERERAEALLRKSQSNLKYLAQENELIAEIGRIVSSTINIEDMYKQFAEKLKKVIPFDLITVNMVSMKDRTRVRIYSDDSRGCQINRTEKAVYPLDGTRTEQVVRTKSCLLTNNKNREDMQRKCPGMLSSRQGVQSTLLIPLISKDEVFGVMSIQSVENDAYSKSDLILAQKISAQIAGAIANAELFRQQQHAEEKIKKQLREKELLLFSNVRLEVCM